MNQCKVATVPSHGWELSFPIYHPEAAVHGTNQILAYTTVDVRSDNGDVTACIHSDLTQSSMDGSKDCQAVTTTMNETCLKNVKFARVCR